MAGTVFNILPVLFNSNRNPKRRVIVELRFREVTT